MSYHCPNCGKEISYGESICPNCKANVTDVWEQTPQPKDSQPKVAPGMGTPNSVNNNPFPPPISNNSGTPFPPPVENNVGAPFPPPAANSSPFPPPAANSSPFPPAAANSSPFPPPAANSSPFPPANDSSLSSPVTPVASISTAYLEIPRIGAKIMIPPNVSRFRIGRNEIQGAATQALPDLNAYKNISRKRENSEHFIIHYQNGQYSIEDIHSTNGTYIGTMKLGPGVPPQPLKDGDKIIVPVEEFGKMVQLEIFFRMP
ncbi:FHA domain-containing protein [Candidatus Harpocratesius sp.]